MAFEILQRKNAKKRAMTLKNLIFNKSCTPVISKLNMEWKWELKYFEAISFYEFPKQVINFVVVIIYHPKPAFHFSYNRVATQVKQINPSISQCISQYVFKSHYEK